MLAPRKMFEINGVTVASYFAAEIGDGLPLHSHSDRGHITTVEVGEIEVFDDTGKTLKVGPGDPPVEFEKDRKHGIRATVAGTVFLNIQ